MLPSYHPYSSSSRTPRSRRGARCCNPNPNADPNPNPNPNPDPSPSPNPNPHQAWSTLLQRLAAPLTDGCAEGEVSPLPAPHPAPEEDQKKKKKKKTKKKQPDTKANAAADALLAEEVAEDKEEL